MGGAGEADRYRPPDCGAERGARDRQISSGWRFDGSVEDWMVSRGAIPLVGAAAELTLPPPSWATLPVATDVAPAVTITAARAAAPVVIRARMVPPGGSPTGL